MLSGECDQNWLDLGDAQSSVCQSIHTTCNTVRKQKTLKALAKHPEPGISNEYVLRMVFTPTKNFIRNLKKK